MSVKTDIDKGNKKRTPAPAEASKRWVGQSVLRHEDPRLLTGRGTFLDDVKIANVHHAAILRSPYAHARIKRIDMSGPSRSTASSPG